MAEGDEKLASIIAEIWDRANRIFPKRTPGATLKYKVMKETTQLVDYGFEIYDGLFGTALWGSSEGAFDPAHNVRWGAGMWYEGE